MWRMRCTRLRRLKHDTIPPRTIRGRCNLTPEPNPIDRAALSLLACCPHARLPQHETPHGCLDQEATDPSPLHLVRVMHVRRPQQITGPLWGQRR